MKTIAINVILCMEIVIISKLIFLVMSIIYVVHYKEENKNS
jgi:hypothetical protein